MTVRTLLDLYRAALIERGKSEAFLVKRDGRYQPVSSGEFTQAGAEVAGGLRALGLAPGDRVALLAETRLEWAVADLGILSAGLVSVPIYPTLTTGSVEHILRDSGAAALIASTPEQAAKAQGILAGTPGFPCVIMEGTPPAGAIGWDTLRERGRQAGVLTLDEASVRPEDLATLIYTSGTTGPPKGVMLTHGNIATNAVTSLERLPILPVDTCLSILPLSHIFERTGGLYCMLHAGATIAYAESLETVAENLREVKPTIMLSVPRLYEKMYARILESAVEGGALRRAIFHWARDVGLARSRATLAGERPGLGTALAFRLADRMLFAKVRARFGGRLRFFVSGGAPLSTEIAAFFHAAGLPILEGYGLTETSPVIAVNSLDSMRLGTVGRPIPGVDVRIAEDGEILARGPSIMLGYYNLPDATTQALDGGWFHTGDIGHLDDAGFLVITDRKKDLIVTAGGKKVAPQPIENRLKTDRFISEAVVLGDNRPYLVALIIPNFENLEAYARHKGMAFQNVKELVAHPQIPEFFQGRVDRHQKDAASFERIKRVHVLDRPLSTGAELTPTLKVRRKVVTEDFAREIAALYGG